MFELFVRKLPPQRHFLVMAGLEQALEWLRDAVVRRCRAGLARAAGRVFAAAAGLPARLPLRGRRACDARRQLFFADEPVLRITAPLPQAQFVESRLLNIVHFQTLIASKAARVVLAAAGRCWWTSACGARTAPRRPCSPPVPPTSPGFAGTATAEAGRRFGVPVFGTMAHSFVQAHPQRTRGLRGLCAGPAEPADAAGRHLRHRGGRRQADRRWPAGWRPRASRSAACASTAVTWRRMPTRCAGCSTMPGSETSRCSPAATSTSTGLRSCWPPQAPIDGFGVGTALDTSIDAAGAGRRLQAAGLRRRGAPQTLRGQGHLAGGQAGLRAPSTPAV